MHKFLFLYTKLISFHRLILVEALEDECVQTASLRPMFRFLLQILHDAGILTEESLLQWIRSRRNMPPDAARRLLFDQPEVQDFVEWIEDEGEGSEEDDDADDSGEESDEASV